MLGKRLVAWARFGPSEELSERVMEDRVVEGEAEYDAVVTRILFPIYQWQLSGVVARQRRPVEIAEAMPEQGPCRVAGSPVCLLRIFGRIQNRFGADGGWGPAIKASLKSGF